MSMFLRQSLVQRGGVTSARWYGDTDRIYCLSNAKGLQFQFSMPSKGGGETSIHLTVGLEDLAELFKELASAHPDLAGALAESTHIAVQALLKSSGGEAAA